MSEIIRHHGIKGQKWGVKNGPPYPLKIGIRTSHKNNKTGTSVSFEKSKYAVDSGKRIIKNADGSKTVPKGFSFNRVGKSSMDVNQSGGLYVSYGKHDAARYVKSLGTTPLRKLFRNTGDAIQHISVKKPLRMPSEKQMITETANILLSDKKLLGSFQSSLYYTSIADDFSQKISEADLRKVLKGSNDKFGQKLAYGVNSFLGDPNYSDESTAVYEYFRKKGYDAIPDIHDRLSGTSETAMIIIAPDKVEVTSTTAITKDVMKSAKKYVGTLEKLKVNDLIK